MRSQLLLTLYSKHDRDAHATSVFFCTYKRTQFIFCAATVEDTVTTAWHRLGNETGAPRLASAHAKLTDGDLTLRFQDFDGKIEPQRLFTMNVGNGKFLEFLGAVGDTVIDGFPGLQAANYRALISPNGASTTG